MTRIDGVFHLKAMSPKIVKQQSPEALQPLRAPKLPFFSCGSGGKSSKSSGEQSTSVTFGSVFTHSIGRNWNLGCFIGALRGVGGGEVGGL